jgi:hypothetical protein
MAVKEKEIYALGITLLGNFNPSIFTPHWLASKDAIRNSEADAANVEIIHPEISKFNLDWLSVEVSQSRADFKTKRESDFMAMRDLVISIFSVLKETPLNAIGLNHLIHYTMRDLKEYENFGYWLSPVQNFSDILNDPKLQNVQYIETATQDKNEGTIRLIISPSDLLTDNKSVLFNCNHHFINDEKPVKEFLDILISKWEYSFTKVENLNKAIWERAKY